MMNFTCDFFKTVDKKFGYKLYDNRNKSKLYFGYNDKLQKSLFLIYEGSISKINSSKFIEVFCGIREDNKSVLRFSVIGNESDEVFYRFCDDVIESLKNSKNSELQDVIITRYKIWKNVFQNIRKGKMSEIEILGLIGELIFLNDYMFNVFPMAIAINSWMGFSRAYKDFEIEDTWYEVKTKRKGALTIKISSVEQLDSIRDGILSVIDIERSNSSENVGFSLNVLVKKIIKRLEDADCLSSFINKLQEYGYDFSEEYDEIYYKKEGMSFYKVNSNFPKIMRKDLKKGIANVSYDIYCKDIKQYRVASKWE